MAFDCFIESWTAYDTTFPNSNLVPSLRSRWTNPAIAAGGAFIDPTGGRRGGPALSLSSVSMNKTMSHSAHWIAGCGMKAGTIDNGGVIFALRNNSQNLFQLLFNSDGTMTLAGATSAQVIATTPNRLMYEDKWVFWEVDVSFSGTTNITCTAELRVDGRVLISGSVATTVNNASLLSQSTTANVFALGAPMTIDGSFYIHNTQGDVPGYWGDGRIVKVLPNGDTAQADWTPNSGSTHYNRINELPKDDDTTYLATATSGNKDSLDWEDIPAFSGLIRVVQVSMAARKDDEGSKAFRIGVGATLTEAVSDDYYVNDSYIYYHFPWDTDPATGLPWTRAGFNAKQFGIELVL